MSSSKQSSPERSAEILQRALNAWGLYTVPYERYALLNEALTNSSADVKNHLWGSLERYIQEERMVILAQHWNGIENGTPQEAEFVTVSPEMVRRVQGIIGFYNVNRLFLFLYVHAYLWHRVLKTGPLDVLNMLVDELDPR
jgi:esterase/lipase superfamily enzyme